MSNGLANVMLLNQFIYHPDDRCEQQLQELKKTKPCREVYAILLFQNMELNI